MDGPFNYVFFSEKKAFKKRKKHEKAGLIYTEKPEIDFRLPLVLFILTAKTVSIRKDGIMNENELSKIAVDCMFKVHKNLGPGLLESSYEECLCYELKKTGLKIDRQKPLPLQYEEVRMEIGYRVDMVIDDKLIIEIKAVEALNDVHKAQVITYLKLSGCKLGLLVNFNVALIKDGIRRVVNGL